jgi:hypothetical protein
MLLVCVTITSYRPPMGFLWEGYPYSYLYYTSTLHGARNFLGFWGFRDTRSNGIWDPGSSGVLVPHLNTGFQNPSVAVYTDGFQHPFLYFVTINRKRFWKGGKVLHPEISSTAVCVHVCMLHTTTIQYLIVNKQQRTCMYIMYYMNVCNMCECVPGAIAGVALKLLIRSRIYLYSIFGP